MGIHLLKTGVIQGAEEAQPLDEITAEGIDGYHALGLEFAEGNLNRMLPLMPGRRTATKSVPSS